MTGPNKLRAYLDEHDFSDADFAAQVGVHKSQVGRWLSEESVPGLMASVRIDRATNGAVPVGAWVETPSKGEA